MLVRQNSFLGYSQGSFFGRNLGGLAELKHFFLPQESNNHRARIIHHSSLSSIIGLFLIVQLVLSSILIVKPSVLGFASQISPEQVVDLTNQERAKAGLSPLKINSFLSEAAQQKAGDMFAFNYWAHSSPSGRDPWDFFKEVGYHYIYAGENLARDFSSPEAAMAAWMASPSHKENILSSKYQEIGIAVVEGTLGGVETTLVIQLFGTPTPAPSPVAQRSNVPPVAAVQSRQISLKPTPTPQPLAFLSSQTSQSLFQATEKEALINPFLLTKELGISILGILVGVIIIDGMIIFRRKTLRLSGRALAHSLFLIGTVLIIIFSSQGAIL